MLRCGLGAAVLFGDLLALLFASGRVFRFLLRTRIPVLLLPHFLGLRVRGALLRGVAPRTWVLPGGVLLPPFARTDSTLRLRCRAPRLSVRVPVRARRIAECCQGDGLLRVRAPRVFVAAPLVGGPVVHAWSTSRRLGMVCVCSRIVCKLP